eukprot:Platyproteum_vivax@DN1712_c0_g1_i1.p1
MDLHASNKGSFLLASTLSSRLFIFKMDHTKDSRCQFDGEPILEDIEPLSTLSTNTHSMGIRCVRWFAPDGDMFYSAGYDQKIKAWASERLDCVATVQCPDAINTIAVPRLDNFHIIAAALSDNTVRLCDLRSATAVQGLRAHRHPVLSAAWDAVNSNVLYTGCRGGKVFEWDIRRVSPLAEVNATASLGRSDHNCEKLSRLTLASSTGAGSAHAGPVCSLVCTDSQLLSCGADGVTHLWSIHGHLIYKTGTIRTNYRFMQGCEPCVNSEARLLIHPGTPHDHHQTGVWNLETGECLQILTGHKDIVKTSAINHSTQELL